MVRNVILISFLDKTDTTDSIAAQVTIKKTSMQLILIKLVISQHLTNKY